MTPSVSRTTTRATPSSSPPRTSRGRRRPCELGVGSARRAPGPALRAGPLGGAAHLPGHGRRGQGRRDQARDVRHQPAGLSGLLVQGAVVRGSRPRFPLALHAMPAGARPHRHLQPQLLRGRRWSSGCTRSSWRSSRLPAELVTKDIWKDRFQDIRAFERYLARNGIVVRKFFLHVSKKEQRKRFLEPHRGAREELEVLRGRRRGARALGRVHGRLRGHDPAHRDGATRRGTSCPRTTSGSRGSWWRRR